ncbi:tape measure protein [Endozoicomonas ascidiicola]|uniref:tape measure protein n=1 Tax=Endozoicomonas ascidiicola TaxID=1698521 RepID=UPI00083509F5|nr:tape measure protein [Endozoicomonas ascidiicola]
MASIKQSAIQLVLKAKDALSGKVRQSAQSLDYLKGEAAELKEQLGKLKDQKTLLSSFEQQTRATHEAGKAFRAAQAKVERLARELDQAEKPTKAMQSALNRARQEVKKSNTAYGRQRETLAKLRGQLTKAGLSSSKLAQQQQKLSDEIDETGYAFEKANKKAKAADRTLKKNTLKKVARDAEQASSGIGRLTRRFTALIAAGAGLYTIKRGIESILTTGDKFERLNVQLEAIMGSMAEGERALAWIKDFTRNTPFQLEEVSEAFVRLKAFGLDPMDGTMQAIVDQASKLGGGMERLNGITLAVGQAWAKQKLQGEEILQLVERGVPVWEMLEKATGKNVQELQKLSTAGKLGRDTIALLIAEIGKSSEGAAAKNMSLLSGYVSNLKDSWQNFLGEIADSGALEYTKNLLGDIANKIEAMNQDGRLQTLAQKISDAFVAMGDAVRHTLSGLTFEGVVARIQTGFAAITGVMGKLQTTFTVTSNTVSFFFNSLSLAVKGFAATFLYTVGEIIYGWGKIAEVLGADSIAKSLQGTTNYLRSLGKEFAKQTAEDANDAKNSLVGIYDALSKKHQSTQQDIRRENKVTVEAAREEQKQYQKELEQTGSTAKQTAETTKAAFTDAADAINQINGAETRTELASLGVAIAEAFTEGTLSLEEYTKATEASRQKLAELAAESEKTKEALKDTGDAAESSAKQQETSVHSMAGAMAAHYNHLTSELMGMSAAAHDAFVNMGNIGSVQANTAIDGISELKNQLQETNDQLDKLKYNPVGDFVGISTWMTETARNAAFVKKEFLQQKIVLEDLLESYEQGEVTARRFVQQGERTAEALNLLNNQDLDRLNNAIRSAEQTMSQLGDSSRNTLDSLQDELDQLQGKQDDIEKRRYENRQNDLKDQKEEAVVSGDQQAIKNLNKALQVSEQIYSERRKEAQQEKRNARQQDQVTRTATPTRIERQPPQKVIRLEYPNGGVNVGIAPTDETKLLEALKNAGMRTL